MEHRSKVLIVDDDFRVRSCLQQLLETKYDVYTAQNGTEAMGVMCQEGIDVVTLDLHLRKPLGITLVQAIKKHDPDIELVIITANTDLKTAIDALHYGVFDYLTKPFNNAEVVSVIHAAAQKRQLNLKLKTIFEELNTLSEARKLTNDTSMVSSEGTETLIKIGRKICYQYFREQQRETINSNDYLRFVKILASTLESKDPYTHGHSERVSSYSSMLSNSLCLGHQREEEIRIAAYLHDIGKIGVSDNLVCKSDKLNDNEWATIQAHPEKGVNLICSMKTSRNIISCVRHHHERYDGRGYPYGLAGDDIPLGGRIIAIADAYDAMTSNRPYRHAISPEQAQEELQKHSGTQFDPKLVNVFLTTLKAEGEICGDEQLG